jgi:Putative transmembrane protein (PGPGW)
MSSGLLWGAGLLSLAFLIVSVVLLPIIVLRLPQDYLSSTKTVEKQPFSKLTVRSRLFLIGRNLLGGLLVLAGIAMLVMPGQGVISIAVGLGLMDFPRKRRIIRRLVGNKRALRAINRFRSKFGRQPLNAPV